MHARFPVFGPFSAFALTLALAAGFPPLLGTLPAQPATDLIHYPFLLNSGTTVRNIAPPTNNPVPATGTFVSTNNGGPWEPQGRIGIAMRGKDSTSSSTYNYIDTGWKGGMTGSMTIAWFMKLRTDLGFLSNNLPNIGYLITGNGSFRMFTGGVGNKGLLLRSWGGSPADLYLGGGSALPYTGYDLHAAARNDWVHVALVIDAAAGEATYYVDGGPMQTTAITGQVNLPASTGNNFRIGAHTATASAFNYDIDEFRLLNRAASQTELQSWALARLQVDKTELSMAAADTQNLTLAAGSGHAGRLYWIFGSVTGVWPGVSFGAVTVPLNPDFYTNLTIRFPGVPPFVGFRGALDGNGAGKASLVLPPSFNDPAAIGLQLYHAFVAHDASGFMHLASNPTVARIVK